MSQTIAAGYSAPVTRPEECERKAEQRQLDTDNGYRAIGRYVVAFSELVSEMRLLVAQHVGGHDRWPLANIALGEANAGPIQHAFFGLCREANDFTAAEDKVASLLSREVGEVVTTRNDIAHGDWLVGHAAFTPRGS
jgi:hypothetical protein